MKWHAKLLHLHIPAAKIQHYTESLRQDYLPLFTVRMRNIKFLNSLKLAEHQYDIQWVLINAVVFSMENIRELELIQRRLPRSRVVRDEKLIQILISISVFRR
ncbi:MAG: hypothetical protein CM1200mP30_25650 [Pseudomonadota bacterium]|nr:MAG: hypothetical protein CM1200mP30_25650 [Pseudomonadota bacterium]